MRFVELSSLLGANWEIYELEALRRLTTPIDTVLYQPCSNKNVAAAGVDDVDSTDCETKYRSFLSLLKAQEPHLAATPEYSCPWVIVREILGDTARFPQQGNLWIFGCNSIRKTELDAFADEFRAQNIQVMYETLNDVPRKFLDPICYFFWIKNSENQDMKKAVLIQFKTQHMGSRGAMQPIEQANLLEGSSVYILSNNATSHRLLTLICSEVMAFTQKDLNTDPGGRWIDNSYLVLSLQLNPKSYHPEFVDFRKKVLEYSNKDLICLNHANGTRVNNHEIITTDGSSLCIQTHEPRTEEPHLAANHNQGCYFHKKNDSVFFYQLSNDEGVFSIQIDRPSLSGARGAVSRKQGPTASTFHAWNGANFVTATLPNYFANYLANLGVAGIFGTHTYLNIERLVCISSGEIKRGTPPDWHKAEKLPLIKVRETDTSQRITVVHNNDDDAGRMRQTRIEQFQELQTIISDNANFTGLINHKRHASSAKAIGFFQSQYGTNYSLNMIIGNNEEGVTVIFLGMTSTEKAKEVFNAARKLFNDGNSKKVIVWYRLGTVLHTLSDEEPPKINDATELDKFTG